MLPAGQSLLAPMITTGMMSTPEVLAKWKGPKIHI